MPLCLIEKQLYLSAVKELSLCTKRLSNSVTNMAYITNLILRMLPRDLSLHECFANIFIYSSDYYTIHANVHLH